MCKENHLAKGKKKKEKEESENFVNHLLGEILSISESDAILMSINLHIKG